MNKNTISNDFVKMKKIKAGRIVKGVVKDIKPYGAFVEISPGIVGILYLNDISFSKIGSPSDVLKKGNKINVKIKKYDIDTGRLTLSTKEFFGTFNENIDSVNENTIVKGIVRNKDKHGVFVQLKPGLVGLANYKDYVSYGDEVNVLVKKISKETERVKLVIVD